MPYATENQISQSPIDGGIEITEQQYADALAGMQDGKIVTIDGGFAIIDKPELESELEPEQESAEPEPVEITVVSRAQGKMALIAAGMWDDVLDYVNGIESPVDKAMAEVALNDTNHWRRDSPFLMQAASAIGLTSEQLDDLFQQASSIDI